MTIASGEKIPAIGLGTFGSDRCEPDEVADAVAGALRFGYRLIDCAAAYRNEAYIGEVFKKAFSSGVVRREDLFIQSKVWNDMHEVVLVALGKTLNDLCLDYVDAYFVHWPYPNYHAPGCDGDARNPDSVPWNVERFMSTWRQMERVYRLGLARHIGMSNMTIQKLEAVLPLCEVKPALIEMEFHPSFQQRFLLDFCVKQGIQPVGFCPLGSPNRPDRDRTPDDVVDMALPEVIAVAKAHNIHPALVCLKWAVQCGVIPIPFSTVEENWKANFICVTGDPLSVVEMATLAEADRNCRLIKGQVFLWPDAKGWEDLWDMEP
jgi:alcohol dehydrogenase (NADP+)